MWILIIPISILVFSETLKHAECISTNIIVRYNYQYVNASMDEDMFSQFYSCMEDQNSIRCTLSLRKNNQYEVSKVSQNNTTHVQQSAFACYFHDDPLEVVCNRTNKYCIFNDYCPNRTFGLAFKILWTYANERTSDEGHEDCYSYRYGFCSFYRKLESIPVTPPTEYTSTSTQTTRTTTQLITSISTTSMKYSETSSMVHSVTEAEMKINETRNKTLHSGENTNVDSIIIGSVVSVVLVVIAGFVILFVWKRRRQSKERNNNENKMEYVNSLNVSISSDQNRKSHHEYDLSNEKYSDNYDQCTATTCSQDNHHIESSNDTLPYSIAGEIQSTRPNTTSMSTHDRYFDHYDQISGKNSSEVINVNEMSIDALPYSNTENMQPNTDHVNRSDKDNNVYQNLNGDPTKRDSKDYNRLGQDVKIFKHDYNCLIQDNETLACFPLDNVAKVDSKNDPVYSMAQRISQNESTEPYS
ncbi:hypothetical protein Btru_055615 [Bulinus truncatus]|nr:hypothetical protein Btru_055615 [Bulinus truncatus]